MVKIVNLIRILSVLLFLGMLGLVYSYLSVVVELTTIKGELTVHREYFFYYFAGGFLVVNIFLWFLVKIVNQLLKTELAQAWFSMIAPAVNVYITFILVFIGIINNPVHASPENFVFLLYLGPIILLIWFLGFFYSMNKKKIEIE